MLTNLLKKKTHQEFLNTTSDLESPIDEDHRKFSVKVAVYICPVLVHLFFTSGDKAMHNTVLCPDLLLSDIRKIQLGFFSVSVIIQKFKPFQDGTSMFAFE